MLARTKLSYGWLVKSIDPAESPDAQRPAAGLGVRVAVLLRWAASGLIAPAGSRAIPGQPFTGFPPLIEQELPVVRVEGVD